MLIISKPAFLKKSKVFLTYLNKFFLSNDIMISKLFLNIFNKTIYLNFYLYFLVSLEKCEKKSKLDTISKHIDYFFKKQFKNFNVQTVVINISNLNKYLRKTKIKELYKKFFKFEKIVFLERTELFNNFLNLTYLIMRKKISVNCYLIILSKIFVRLIKRSHSRFFLFLKVLINWCVLKNKLYSKVTGIKININGRIKGKPRSGNFKFLCGKIPCQTIKSEIKFSFLHAYNRYGAFGLKLWINY